MFFDDDKEEILEKVADVLATCKHKLDHKECTLEKCNNCSFGYILQFSKKYMSEMELDYIKMLSQLRYETTEYTHVLASGEFNHYESGENRQF